jgi:hypothetical protein
VVSDSVQTENVPTKAAKRPKKQVHEILPKGWAKDDGKEFVWIPDNGARGCVYLLQGKWRGCWWGGVDGRLHDLPETFANAPAAMAAVEGYDKQEQGTHTVIADTTKPAPEGSQVLVVGDGRTGRRRQWFPAVFVNGDPDRAPRYVVR